MSFTIGSSQQALRPRRINFLYFALAFGIIGGIAALLLTRAAVPLVIDSSVPQPQNPRVYADDRSLIVTWDDTRPQGVVGYYLQYKKKGALAWENVRQTIHNSIQLQPLENGVEYEITIQSARGNYLTTPKGDIVNHDSSDEIYWARADGHVSQAVAVSGTPSSARIESMRNRLTAFFDDFNEPANPFNELEWNQASFCNHPDSAMAFINNQFHSHNAISCGFGGVVSRPRATFDTSVGLNGGPISETNPAQIEFDMDIGVDGRSKWYLDLVPLSVRHEKYPTDIDGHHTADDSMDHEEPGNMLRFDVGGSGYGAAFTYWDKNRNFSTLYSWEPPSVCGNWSRDWGNGVDFRVNNGCPTSSKTLGQSPLLEQNLPLLKTAQNVRRHWVMQFTPTKVKVFVDSAQIMQATLPADWAAEKKYTLQNTMFSYNTAKQFETHINSEQHGDFMGRRGVIPYFHFYHWDNFGFTGPRPTTVTHNYIDGGPDGTSPAYLNNVNIVGNTNRTSNIKIPDPIGNPINNRGKLFMTLRSRDDCGCNWSPNDFITFNGKRYNIPDPETVGPGMPDFSNGFAQPSVTLVINVDKADLKTGDNVVVFNGSGTVATNLHLELEYTNGTAPSYTHPITIYGHALSNIVEPRLTNCDSYIYVEQDLGLPYLGGKQNLEVGPCEFLQTTPHHEGVGRILNALNFEAEELNLSSTVITGSDPNASKGAYIQY